MVLRLTHPIHITTTIFYTSTDPSWSLQCFPRRPPSWWGGGQLLPPQEPHPCSGPFGPHCFSPPKPKSETPPMHINFHLAKLLVMVIYFVFYLSYFSPCLLCIVHYYMLSAFKFLMHNFYLGIFSSIKSKVLSTHVGLHV